MLSLQMLPYSCDSLYTTGKKHTNETVPMHHSVLAINYLLVAVRLSWGSCNQVQVKLITVQVVLLPTIQCRHLQQVLFFITIHVGQLYCLKCLSADLNRPTP